MMVTPLANLMVVTVATPAAVAPVIAAAVAVITAAVTMIAAHGVGCCGSRQGERRRGHEAGKQ